MMYSILLPRFLTKSCLERITTRIPALLNLRPNLSKRNFVSALKSKVENDVVLYNLEKPKFFFYVKLLSGVNCLFWTTIGIQGLVTFTDADDARIRMGLGDSFIAKLYTSKLLATFALLFGLTSTVLMNMYVLQSIRTVILNKGGRSVTFITYSVPGFKNQFKYPLSDISAVDYRRTERGFFPIKVKHRFLYYLIDCEGQVKNEMLFNSTLGVRRHLK